MKIKTNNVPREIVHGFDLPEDARGEFDYYSETELLDASFFKYRGDYYDLGEFLVWDNPASPTRENWDGFRSDSFFSGVCVRYVNDYEEVVVGLVLS
jgi:hypothetical protein